MKKVREDAIPELAGIYNTDGKQGLYSCLRDRYGIREPGSFLRRMKTNPKLGYDAETDMFAIEQTAGGAVFLSMDDLCAEHKSFSAGSQAASAVKQSAARWDPEEEMKKMIQELIGDRLLELSRYVKLDSRSKTVLIDATSLKHDGYSVVNH